MAESPTPTRRRATRQPGESLGFPMYHTMTGNLPVVTTKYHHRVDSSERALNDDSYHYMSGNLPILSRELMREDDDDLMPGWISLIDPITKRSFWWNMYYRSRREVRPSRSDDGRVGSGRGELEGKLLATAFCRRHAVADADDAAAPRCVQPDKTWQQLWDARFMRAYYWNRRTNETVWTLPAGVSTHDCVPYDSLWSPVFDADKRAVHYYCKVLNQRSEAIPIGYDNTPLLDMWRESVDPVSGLSAYTHSLTGDVVREKPPGWPRPAPHAPPHAAPTAEAPLATPEDIIAKLAQSMALSGTASSSLSDDEDRPENPNLIFLNMKGYLRKEGGGTSIFGKKSWKERYFVAQAGVLGYYENQAEFEQGRPPIKHRYAKLRNYTVDIMAGDPLKFALVPNATAAPSPRSPRGSSSSVRDVSGGRPSSPSHSPDIATRGGSPVSFALSENRVLLVEALTPASKAKWVRVLRGRRIDGLHRADSDTVLNLLHSSLQ